MVPTSVCSSDSGDLVPDSTVIRQTLLSGGGALRPRRVSVRGIRAGRASLMVQNDPVRAVNRTHRVLSMIPTEKGTLFHLEFRKTMYPSRFGFAVLPRLAITAVICGGTFVVHANDLPDLAARSGETLFTELSPEKTGLDFVNPLLPDHPKNYLYPFGYACGGVSIGDLDGDDRADVFCVGGPESNGLFLQLAPDAENPDGELRFARVEGAKTDGGFAWGTGASLVDIDGDGDLDIYVCNYDTPNQLYINRSTPGNPKFTEEAAAYRLNIRDASITSTFADIDNDGDLDAYVGCNRYVPPKGLPMEAPGEYDPETGTVTMFPKYERYFRAWKKPDGNFEGDSYGRDDYLLLNNGPDAKGQIKFSRITEPAGIEGSGHALSATWLDIDEDGLLDLHVANDFEDPDRLYRNLGPDSRGMVRFENVIGDVLPYTSWSSMGADQADLDGDGLLDLMVADMSATTHFKAKVNMGEMGGRQRQVLEEGWPRQAMRNMLYLNTGRGVYREGGFMAGLNSSDWTWAVKLADFDQDGMPDAYFTNGMSRNYTDSDVPFSGRQRYGRTQWDHFRDQPPLAERNMAFRNSGDLRFDDVSEEWGLDKNGMSYSAAYGDLDGDGDQDLVVANLDGPVSIYRNEATGNWLNVRLRGSGSNRHGIGAIVRLSTESHGTLTRMANPWTGWASTNGSDLHFGLGDDEQVNSIEVIWPGNRVQRLGATKANQLLVIEESAELEDRTTRPEANFTDASGKVGPDFVHRENVHDDFKAQPLLPGKLSAFGPCMAWGDVNDDGRIDVFFGGARNQAGELWLNGGQGRFTKASEDVLGADSICEDADACWFDAEGDGDLDLLVASGSVEHLEGDYRLLNRLYLNQGLAADGVSPRFERAPDSVLADLAFSSGAVAAGDFDRDGDIDLFIGSRSVPGLYPTTPKSHLLLNESSEGEVRFADATERLAPGLSEVGLVTDADWMDADGDGWDDLVVSTEWGPVHLWRNDDGRLLDATDTAGLGGMKGWWNGLRAVDVDGDGDTDLLALNVGLNTKYGRPTAESPAILYYGDMDGSGTPHLVEAKSKKNDLLPVRGRSCSANAMPVIRQNFGTFRDFALADLPTIYTAERLDGAMQFEANGFESGVWINESTSGAPAFEFQAFPSIVQISPAYGAAVADFNGDGFTDVFLAQNHDHREPETGIWRGGVGQMLHGTESGEYVPATALETGILLRGDATSAEAVDVDGDGDPDLVATQNNDRVRVFLNQR